MATFEKKPDQNRPKVRNKAAAVTSGHHGVSRMTVRQKIITGLVLLPTVLLLGGTMIYLYIGRERPASETVDTGRVDYDQANRQINGMVLEKDYAAALATADSYLKTAKNKTYRSAVYAKKADIYERTNEFDNAIDAYQHAEREHGSGDYSFFAGIARNAQKKGDKALAIQNYKKAIEMLENQNVPDAAMDIDSMKQQLIALEAS